MATKEPRPCSLFRHVVGELHRHLGGRHFSSVNGEVMAITDLPSRLAARLFGG